MYDKVTILQKKNDDGTKTQMWFVESSNGKRGLLRKDFIEEYVLTQSIFYPDGEIGRKNGNDHYKKLLEEGYKFKKRFIVEKTYTIREWE